MSIPFSDNLEKIAPLPEDIDDPLSTDSDEDNGGIAQVMPELPSPTRLISHKLIDYLHNETGHDHLIRDGQRITIAYGCQLIPFEVVRLLIQHFTARGLLKDPNNRRLIYLDPATSHLLGIEPQRFVSHGGSLSEQGEPIIDLLQIQLYLQPHFTRA